jgi:hypothetical protein
MKLVRFCLTLSMASMASLGALAQTEPANLLPGRPDAHASTKPVSLAGLGPTFESAAAGIAFKPPADSTQIRRASAGDEIVRYVNDDKKWDLRVSLMSLSKAMPLAKSEDKNGVVTNGMVEYLSGQMQNQIPGLEVKRQDVTNLGDTPVGMIAVRYQLGLDNILKQEAIVPAYLNDATGVPPEGRTSRAFYIFDMTSPAPKSGDLETDANVKEAVDIFGRIIDSVKVLDQDQLKQELIDRKMRTRTLLVNLTPPRIREALVKEQWLRLMRDGKDIGYSYIVEQEAQDLPKKGVIQEATNPESAGVLIGIRSRTVPGPDQQVDSESWMFATLNRRHEAWQTTGLVQGLKGTKQPFSEYGASDMKTRSMIDPELLPGEKTRKGEDKMQPPVREVDEYTLNVTHVPTKTGQPPLNQRLPPWYLPQALGHLLPRLVAKYEGKTYVFASYSSDSNDVMNRFVDVGFEEDVELGGQKVRAIPVTDRLGYEGARTVHYVSTDGKYLGSVNEQSKITMLATDRVTLEKLWKNANLTKPGEIEPATAPVEKQR